MSEAPVQNRRWLLRLLIVAPLTTAAACTTLWIVSNVRAAADQLGWPLWVVALLGGLVVGGPLLFATAALNDRLLQAAGLPPFMRRLFLGGPDTDRDST